MTELLELDIYLFELINGQWHVAFLDQLMPLWRNKYLWIPLYLFILVFILSNYPRKGWILILGLLATIGLADVVSSHLIKKNVKRQRPCQQEELRQRVYLLIPCGGGYSFTSSHATNHFAIAGFLFFTLGQRFRRIRWPLMLWAASIAYGQVYVGVHFPSDILVGALLGCLLAYGMTRFLRRGGRLDFIHSISIPNNI